MTNSRSLTTVPGLIDLGNRLVAADVPFSFLALDALAWARSKTLAYRHDALDPDYTPAERNREIARADALEEWAVEGGVSIVPFSVDVFLHERTAIRPAVVTEDNLAEYLEAVLEASEIRSLDTIADPQFAFRADLGEIWLSARHVFGSGRTAKGLRHAREFSGPDIQVVDANSGALKALIAIHKVPKHITGPLLQ